jgi:type II secretory pathway pseudopilin PulG
MLNPFVHSRHQVPRCDRGGWTLMEMMITVAISTIVMASLMTVMLFATKDFKAMANYAELNQSSRYALDVMNRDFQNASRVVAGDSDSITLTNSDGDRFSYAYDSTATTLTRYFTNSDGDIYTKVLLTNCDALAFSFFMRVPTNAIPTNSYGPFFIPVGADKTETKLVNVDWKCSRTIQGAKANTESVQTAQIAIRN